MQSVLMRIDGDGVLWALTKVQGVWRGAPYLATEVVRGPVT